MEKFVAVVAVVDVFVRRDDSKWNFAVAAVAAVAVVVMIRESRWQ